MLRSTLVSLLTLLACGALARAQVVSGSVSDSASGAPVNGAVVVLLNADGATVASAFTDERGEYAVRLGGAGSVRVRVERIGFSGHLGPSLDVAVGETIRHDVRLVRRAAALRAVEVRTSRQCAAMREADLAMVALWQDIRAALQAAAATRAENAFIYEFTVFERERSRDGDELRMQRLDRRTTRAARPFASVSVDTLVRDGYVVQKGDEWEYRAPDAEVLLDGRFLETHCFRNVRHPTHRDSLVGLGFEPVSGSSKPDVRGVLWVDRESRELRRLEFSYTNLDLPVRTDELGGWLEFRQTPNGRWIVSRWLVRMPMIAGREERRGGMGGEMRPRRTYTLTGFREAGGDVAYLAYSDGRRLGIGPGAVLTGAVYDSVRRAPLAGARVLLPGTPYSTIADERGRFRLDSVPAGEYMVSASHPFADSLGAGSPSKLVQLLTGDTLTVALATRPLGAVGERLCPERRRGDHEGIIHGTVRDSATGRPIAGADVTAIWKTYRLTGGVVQVLSDGRTTKTTGDGRYVLCAIPGDASVAIAIAHASYEPAEVSESFGSLPIAMRNVELERAQPR